MLYSMISRDRSDVMVNVFRCDRKAFNLIVLLDRKKISTVKFEKNFCFFFGYILSETEEKHVDESEYGNGTKEVPIFCVKEKPNNKVKIVPNCTAHSSQNRKYKNVLSDVENDFGAGNYSVMHTPKGR